MQVPNLFREHVLCFLGGHSISHKPLLPQRSRWPNLILRIGRSASRMKFSGAARVLAFARQFDNAGLTCILTINAAVFFARLHFTCAYIVLALILVFFTRHEFTLKIVSRPALIMLNIG
jgi:hypothetical protein